MKEKERKSAINGFRLCVDELLTWVSGLPRSTATSIHPLVQYAKVTLLEISPCQGPIVKRSGVAYSCSYVLLIVYINRASDRLALCPRRSNQNPAQIPYFDFTFLWLWLAMISSRKDACARALFFVSSPTASGVQLPFETNSILIFRQAFCPSLPVFHAQEIDEWRPKFRFRFDGR